MDFPTISEVAKELRLVNQNVECDEEGCDVRLQVFANGDWRVHFGDPQYDTDHRGYWGASAIPGVVGGAVGRFDSMDTARDLLDQAKDDAAQDGQEV